jgi:cell division septation protein DedD
VVRDIPGIDIASFTERSQVTDDAISNAERLLEACRTFKGAGDAPLPYKDAMEMTLGAAIDAASKEWEKQLAHKANVQAMLIETRSAAVTLQRELVAFRGSLRAEIGRNHVDYRALRTHAKAPEDDIEEVVEPDTTTPEAVTPATAAAATATATATTPTLTPTKEPAAVPPDPTTTARTNGASTTVLAA